MGHLKIINFPFGTIENLSFLYVPILKPIMVSHAKDWISVDFDTSS